MMMMMVMVNKKKMMVMVMVMVMVRMMMMMIKMMIMVIMMEERHPGRATESHQLMIRLGSHRETLLGFVCCGLGQDSAPLRAPSPHVLLLPLP